MKSGLGFILLWGAALLAQSEQEFHHSPHPVTDNDDQYSFMWAVSISFLFVILLFVALTPSFLEDVKRDEECIAIPVEVPVMPKNALVQRADGSYVPIERTKDTAIFSH